MKSEIETNCEDIEELKSYKYLLGDFGIQILVAIARGARNQDSILMLSGVPLACVVGRIPVLLNLKLVIEISSSEYETTEKGIKFLKCMNEFM